MFCFLVFSLPSVFVSLYFYAFVNLSLLISLSWQYGVGCGFMAQVPCWISLWQPFERAFISISLVGLLAVCSWRYLLYHDMCVHFRIAISDLYLYILQRYRYILCAVRSRSQEDLHI